MHPAITDPVHPTAVLDSFARVLAVVESMVNAVEPSQLSEPTPCTDWDIRALIGHLAEVNLRYAALANGQPLEHAAEHRAADPISAFPASGQAAREAFSRPGMLHQRYPSPWGEVPGAVLVQHVINELLAHGWDLARATGRSTNLAPEVAEEALGVLRVWMGSLPRIPGGPFGPEQAAPPGASPADRLAAYLGRAV